MSRSKLKKIIKFSIFIVLLILFIFWCLKDSLNTIIEIPPISPYTEFEEHLKNGEVDIVYYPSSGDEFRYCLLNEETSEMSVTERAKYNYDASEYYRTYYPIDNEEFLTDLVKMDIRIEQASFEPISLKLIGMIIPLLFYSILIVCVILIVKKMTLDSVEIEVDYNSKVKFKDVIGHDEVIEDLKFYVELLNGKLHDKNLNVPKGILLTGPPGTGKTLIAKAIAGESQCPFFSLNSSSIIDVYAGKGAKNIRDAFRKARQYSPCVLFIDEIDAVGGSRQNHNQSSSEDRQTLNALLQEMDGFSTKHNILIIAATNDPDHLDPALKRSGRFDREIKVMPPSDFATLKRLYEYHLFKKQVDKNDMDYNFIVKQSTGLTGADIANICNEAGLINLARHGNGISTDDLVIALEKFILKGSPSKKEINKFESKIVRYHEAGHAVMNYLQGIEIQKITVVPTTSGAGGYVKSPTPVNMLHINKTTIENQIRVLYGGRVSEEIKFGEDNVTIGSTTDITEASKLIKAYITQYSYAEHFSYLDTTVFNEEFSNGMLNSAKGIAQRLSTETHTMLTENYFLVEALANKLVETPTLTGDEVKALLDKSKQKRLDKKDK